jgi:hypothetical protein
MYVLCTYAGIEYLCNVHMLSKYIYCTVLATGALFPPPLSPPPSASPPPHFPHYLPPTPPPFPHAWKKESTCTIREILASTPLTLFDKHLVSPVRASTAVMSSACDQVTGGSSSCCYLCDAPADLQCVR